MTDHPLHDIEQSVRELRIETSEDTDSQILEAAGLELEEATRRAEATRRSRGFRNHSLRRRALRFAVAVAAVLVLIAGFELVTGFGSQGVAWAQVVDRIARADRFSFRLGIALPGEGAQRQEEIARTVQQEDVAMEFFFSSALGFRWDVYTEGEPAMSFVHPAGARAGIGIDYSGRTWAYLPASEKSRPDSPVRDPEGYIRRFLARDHEDLGTRVIDGIEVEGIEVVDPPTQDGPDLNGVGRLWVSVETGLPARLELVQRAGEQRVEWVLDFRWGEQVDADAFRPVAPEDFSQVPFELWQTTAPGAGSLTR